MTRDTQLALCGFELRLRGRLLATARGGNVSAEGQQSPEIHMNYMLRRTFVATLLIMGVGLPSAVRAQDSPQASGTVTLFENVHIFDGKSATLSAPSSVLVRGNK